MCQARQAKSKSVCDAQQNESSGKVMPACGLWVAKAWTGQASGKALLCSVLCVCAVILRQQGSRATTGNEAGSRVVESEEFIVGKTVV